MHIRVYLQNTEKIEKINYLQFDYYINSVAIIMASQKKVYDQVTGCTVNVWMNNNKIRRFEITKLFTTWIYDQTSEVVQSFEKGFTKGFADGEFTDLIKKALESPDRHIYRETYTREKYEDDLSDACKIM